MNHKQEKKYREYLKQKQGKGKKSRIKNKKKLKSHFNTSIESRIQNLRNQQLKSNNKLEKRLKKILDNLEIEYVYQKVFRNGNKFKIADFYLVKHNIVFECDGSYHDSEEAKESDEERTTWLIERAGVKEVLRIHYKQFYTHNKEENTETLIRFLEDL